MGEGRLRPHDDAWFTARLLLPAGRPGGQARLPHARRRRARRLHGEARHASPLLRRELRLGRLAPRQGRQRARGGRDAAPRLQPRARAPARHEVPPEGRRRLRRARPRRARPLGLVRLLHEVERRLLHDGLLFEPCVPPDGRGACVLRGPAARDEGGPLRDARRARELEALHTPPPYARQSLHGPRPRGRPRARLPEPRERGECARREAADGNPPRAAALPARGSEGEVPSHLAQLRIPAGPRRAPFPLRRRRPPHVLLAPQLRREEELV